ncbi:hypothetical protein ThidrDRAFT_1911 [Thiorhodococcus drewsii AZ1]|uniref:histidine kinase n=2 Tax=Thiorhodococcus drewsii TaxID=210408 RepID=G2E0T8_9GAMM|nr:hypothetical protein ThidrDRAFT_1911 [Thiorhodococcus drewsii AZ1]
MLDQSAFPFFPLDPDRERLADLERRSLLAEQARQQAHHLRTPLSVIKLISETLQLDLFDDRSHRERLQRLLGAASTLSNGLSDAVRSTGFGDGPQQRLDGLAVAADVMRLHGGRVVTPDDGMRHSTEIEIEPDSFEAALVHCLRFLGIGTDCGWSRGSVPVMDCEAGEGRLRLRLSVEGGFSPDIPTERADLQLMALAAERCARDCGGTLTLTAESATFELPLAPPREGSAA